MQIEIQFALKRTNIGEQKVDGDQIEILPYLETENNLEFFF